MANVVVRDVQGLKAAAATTVGRFNAQRAWPELYQRKPSPRQKQQQEQQHRPKWAVDVTAPVLIGVGGVSVQRVQAESFNRLSADKEFAEWSTFSATQESSRLHCENLELRNELDIGPDEATPRQVINALTQSVETLGSTNDALAAALAAAQTRADNAEAELAAIAEWREASKLEKSGGGR